MEFAQKCEDFEVFDHERMAILGLAERAAASPFGAEPCHVMVGAAPEGAEDAMAGDDDLRVARELARRLAARIGPHLDIISVRVLLSPPGAGRQGWHLDYARHFRDVLTVFLSASPATADNCTEVLDLGGRRGEVAELARSTLGPLPQEQWYRIEDGGPTIHALTSEPWGVCAVRTSHAFHRRGANKTDFTRITFNVDLACLAEQPEFVDADLLDSLPHRICSRYVIDSLDEHDVTLGGDIV